MDGQTYIQTIEKSEESLRQQKMGASISTSSSGGWSHATLMLRTQNPMEPFLWMKLMTSPDRLRLGRQRAGEVKVYGMIECQTKNNKVSVT